MAFFHNCEECGNKINKFDSSSPFYFVTDGSYVKCSQCQAKYKTKFRIYLFYGFSLEILLMILYLLIGFSLSLDFIYVFATMPIFLAVYRVVMIFFIPLKRIDEKKENIQDYDL